MSRWDCCQILQLQHCNNKNCNVKKNQIKKIRCWYVFFPFFKAVNIKFCCFHLEEWNSIRQVPLPPSDKPGPQTVETLSQNKHVFMCHPPKNRDAKNKTQITVKKQKRAHLIGSCSCLLLHYCE